MPATSLDSPATSRTCSSQAVPMTMRALLVRGMAVGVLAAAVAFGFAWAVGEPQIAHAITFEDTVAIDGSAHADMARTDHTATLPALVSRTVQSTLGLATGLAVLGIAYGGTFAVVFAVVWGRVRGLHVRGTAMLVAGAGFMALFLIPFLKYPANPPAVGAAETIGARTAWYVGIMAAGTLLVGGFFVLRNVFAEVRPSWSMWDVTIVSAAVTVAVLIGLFIVLPDVDEVPDGFPAVVLWRFRVASVGIHACLWLTLGLVFGALSERAMRRAPVARA